MATEIQLEEAVARLRYLVDLKSKVGRFENCVLKESIIKAIERELGTPFCGGVASQVNRRMTLDIKPRSRIIPQSEINQLVDEVRRRMEER